MTMTVLNQTWPFHLSFFHSIFLVLPHGSANPLSPLHPILTSPIPYLVLWPWGHHCLIFCAYSSVWDFISSNKRYNLLFNLLICCWLFLVWYKKMFNENCVVSSHTEKDEVCNCTWHYMVLLSVSDHSGKSKQIVTFVVMQPAHTIQHSSIPGSIHELLLLTILPGTGSFGQSIHTLLLHVEETDS